MKRIAQYLTCIFTLNYMLLTPMHASEESGQMTASDIVRKSQLAFYSAGNDMRARVTMDLIDAKGKKRTHVMTMLRRNTDEKGNQKYFIYFHEPGDVRQMTFMVWKYTEKDDDRWIFIPSVDLIRRISADDNRSSFVGSDFSHEDISGRDVSSDTHELLGDETINGRECYLIQSIPLDQVDYVRKLSWIDKVTFLPLQESYFDLQDELFRQFTAVEIKEITIEQGGQTIALPTVVKRTMANIKRNHRTEVTFESISYNIGLDDKDFSERNMRRPPRSWIK